MLLDVEDLLLRRELLLDDGSGRGDLVRGEIVRLERGVRNLRSSISGRRVEGLVAEGVERVAVVAMSLARARE